MRAVRERRVRRLAGGLSRCDRAAIGLLCACCVGCFAPLAVSVAAEPSTGAATTGAVRRTSTPTPPWRTGVAALGRHGVALGGFLQVDGSHVIAGGIPDALWLDKQYLLDLNVTVDTRALFGWPGGTLFVDFQSHSGPNVVARQVPVLADADNMDAPTFNAIDRAWYQQDFFGKKLQLQAGLMYVDDRFLTVPYGQNFVSLDFSSDASISTFVLPTYPRGAWGVEAWAYPTAHLSFAVGAFRDHATELPYDPGGNLLITEEAWRGTWHGLPYKLQLGAWTDDGRFRRFDGAPVRRGSGVYLVASDKLWAPAAAGSRGVGVFLQLGSGPPSVAAVRRHFGLGLVWTGPDRRRPHDEFGIALSDSFLSPEAGFAHGFEKEIETYYQFDLHHGWTLQPDLEYWQHAGGGTTPDTWLGLVRAVFAF
ncbi:MAG TPA: carbohydrate porin [Rhodanobacteraceae bacterium]